MPESRATPAPIDPALVAAILELSADAIITVSPDDRITSWNRGAQAMFGWAAAEVVGRDFALLLPAERIAAGELEWIRAATATDGAITDFETRRRRKDGTVFDVSLTRTAVFDEQHEAIGYSSIVRDISYRKRIERQLLASERLGTAGLVAAGVAREIGAPLTAISIMLDQLIKVRCPHCGGTDQMLLLRTQTDRIARLARDLIAIGKPPGIVARPTRIDEVIRAAADLAMPQLREHGVTMDLQVPDTLPMVAADLAQLQQVLLSLFFNAQMALGTDGGTVTVAAAATADGEVAVSIADDGPGIAKEDLSRVFTPFFTRVGASGLGLAIAAQIVQAHHGTLEVDSAGDRGATFTITLPGADARD